MRILVVGAGRVGMRVLRQLKKNPDLTVLTMDPNERPLAVEEGLIPAVDLTETLTPLTMEYVLRKTSPDLILLTTASEDLGLGTAPGIDILADSLKRELAGMSPVPLIEVARSS